MYTTPCIKDIVTYLQYVIGDMKGTVRQLGYRFVSVTGNCIYSIGVEVVYNL